MRKFIYISLLLAVLSACGGQVDRQAIEQVAGNVTIDAVGNWGGEGVSAIITTSGAKIYYNCSHGIIDGPIKINASGEFNATGMYIFEKANPIGSEMTVPAEFIGIVSQDTLKLTAVIPDIKQTLPTFVLQRNSNGRIIICP